MGPHTDRSSDPGKDEKQGTACLAHLAQLDSHHPQRSCAQSPLSAEAGLKDWALRLPCLNTLCQTRAPDLTATKERRKGHEDTAGQAGCAGNSGARLTQQRPRLKLGPHPTRPLLLLHSPQPVESQRGQERAVLSTFCLPLCVCSHPPSPVRTPRGCSMEDPSMDSLPPGFWLGLANEDTSRRSEGGSGMRCGSPPGLTLWVTAPFRGPSPRSSLCLWVQGAALAFGPADLGSGVALRLASLGTRFLYTLPSPLSGPFTKVSSNYPL